MGSRKTDYLRHSTSGSSSGPRSRFFGEIYKYVGQSARARVRVERRICDVRRRVPKVSEIRRVNIYRNFFLLYVSRRTKKKTGGRTRLSAVLFWLVFCSSPWFVTKETAWGFFYSCRENSYRCSRSFEKTCSLSQEAASIAQHKQWAQTETITLILPKCMKHNQASCIILLIYINVGFFVIGT